MLADTVPASHSLDPPGLDLGRKEYVKAVIVTLLIGLICRVHHEKRWAG